MSESTSKDARQPSAEELAQAKRDWLEAIHPLVVQKSSVLGLGGMRVAINADGSYSEAEHIITDEQREIIAELDDLIESMKPAILRSAGQE